MWKKKDSNWEKVSKLSKINIFIVDMPKIVILVVLNDKYGYIEWFIVNFTEWILL